MITTSFSIIKKNKYNDADNFAFEYAYLRVPYSSAFHVGDLMMHICWLRIIVQLENESLDSLAVCMYAREKNI